MKAIAAVMAMKWMYNLRKALKRNDHSEIFKCQAMYEEWHVRTDEIPTSVMAKYLADELIERTR